MYPSAWLKSPVTIYCHNMNGTPKEFLSLHYYNGGVHPHVYNRKCHGKDHVLEKAGPHDGSSNFSKIRINLEVGVAFLPFRVRSGQVRSECLTCTFRASCCSARLSRAQVTAFAGSSVRDRGEKWGEGVRGGGAWTGGYKGVRAVRPDDFVSCVCIYL